MSGRVVVYGAGAIGGVLGARLALAGHDVALIARGAHYNAIREHGLRLESPDGAETVRLPVVREPRELELGLYDVVFLTMKSQDTDAAVAALAGAAGPETPIVCAQNGVANERMALRRFANVYGLCVMCPAEHLEPGVVGAHSGPIVGLMDLGRYPAGTDAVCEALTALLVSAGYESVPREDIMRWKYCKLLLNLGNVVQAVCAPRTGRRRLAELARQEGQATLDAAGIAYTSSEEDLKRRGDRIQIREIAGRPRGGGSTWQSLLRRTGTIETDFLNGEIVLLGREHGFATSVNELLQETGRRAAAEQLAPESLRADELLAQLG